ncbi:39S ribosomal protein L44, mitochondrial [Macrosteles quadrilineatus]|uniref:39S ribosomal protein L44, mitochondrial n=1 Tax=Macrosteles quadrilineatus TaxID=74068 RepID=UPI0023E1FEF7|nr:39S ribosomal protein L44, mitochondrial [Macrosteles quadrilineatus]
MALAMKFFSSISTTRTHVLSRCTNSLFSANSGPGVIASLKVTSPQLQINRGHKRYVRAVKAVFKKRKEQMVKDNMGPLPPQPRNTYPEWNYNAELFGFGKRLNENFNKELLQRAFVERSYIIMEEEKQKKVGIEEPKIMLKDNTEFVLKGESLIKNFIKRYLRTVYPKYPEEGICSITDYLLSDAVLAEISRHIGTTDIILTSDHPPSVNSLANVLKAIIHALELSSGEERACAFIRDFIITYLSDKDINELWEINEPETVLASILQRDGRCEAEPRIIGDAGKGTILAAYQIGLFSDKEFIGMGFGESIAVARDMAARDALKRLFQTTERARPIPFNLVLKANDQKPFANISIQDWCEKNVKSLMT